MELYSLVMIMIMRGILVMFQQLDEVQSYILAERSFKHNNVAVDSMPQESLHMVSRSMPQSSCYNLIVITIIKLPAKFSIS